MSNYYAYNTVDIDSYLFVIIYHAWLNKFEEIK